MDLCSLLFCMSYVKCAGRDRPMREQQEEEEEEERKRKLDLND